MDAPCAQAGGFDTLCDEHKLAQKDHLEEALSLARTSRSSLTSPRPQASGHSEIDMSYEFSELAGQSLKSKGHKFDQAIEMKQFASGKDIDRCITCNAIRATSRPRPIMEMGRSDGVSYHQDTPGNYRQHDPQSEVAIDLWFLQTGVPVLVDNSIALIICTSISIIFSSRCINLTFLRKNRTLRGAAAQTQTCFTTLDLKVSTSHQVLVSQAGKYTSKSTRREMVPALHAARDPSHRQTVHTRKELVSPCNSALPFSEGIKDSYTLKSEVWSCSSELYTLPEASPGTCIPPNSTSGNGRHFSAQNISGEGRPGPKLLQRLSVYSFHDDVVLLVLFVTEEGENLGDSDGGRPCDMEHRLALVEVDLRADSEDLAISFRKGNLEGRACSGAQLNHLQAIVLSLTRMLILYSKFEGRITFNGDGCCCECYASEDDGRVVYVSSVDQRTGHVSLAASLARVAKLVNDSWFGKRYSMTNVQCCRVLSRRGKFLFILCRKTRLYKLAGHDLIFTNAERLVSSSVIRSTKETIGQMNSCWRHDRKTRPRLIDSVRSTQIRVHVVSRYNSV
ncbi:hypothetical protein KCU89_g154, partial [Aureobasidium melanogenum]